MVNHPSSELPIHIMDPLEGFNQSNRLEPGQERLTTVRSERLITFRAGRNGEVLSQINCTLSGDIGSFTAGRVTWADERLTCEDRLAPI
jgi:hypothetical protein